MLRMAYISVLQCASVWKLGSLNSIEFHCQTCPFPDFWDQHESTHFDLQTLCCLVTVVTVATSPMGRLQKISRLFQAPWSRCSTSRHTKQKTSWPRWLPTTGERLRFWRKVMLNGLMWRKNPRKTQTEMIYRTCLIYFSILVVGLWCSSDSGSGLTSSRAPVPPVINTTDSCTWKVNSTSPTAGTGLRDHLPLTEKIGSSCLVEENLPGESRRVS